MLTAGGDDHRPPRRRRRAASIATRRHERPIHLRPEHRERVGTSPGNHGGVPGGAERAEERHVGFIEPLAAAELPPQLMGWTALPSRASLNGNSYSCEEDPSVTIHALG